LRASGKKRVSLTAPPTISARLIGQVALETHANGSILACFDGHGVSLGNFGAEARKRAHDLRSGLPLALLAGSRRTADQELELLVRRLAQRGLLEYRFGPARKNDTVIIEPQVADYWPRAPKLAAAETIVLSRFAYLRRRGNEMILESPLAGALFRICDSRIATVLATLCTPQKVSAMKRQPGFPGPELLGLLMDCQIVLKVDLAIGWGLRQGEGDENLALWDFHDLAFHARSTQGRHANPSGGLYPYAGVISPPPAVRPRWPGKVIDLRAPSSKRSETVSPIAGLLHERHSTRDFDHERPITLGEIAGFLDGAARIHTKWKRRLDLSDDGPEVAYAARPYPSGGSAYELELYLAVSNCEGLASGFYHYDADRHALVPIAARKQELEALLAEAEFAMDAAAPPQVLITVAARFARVSWKYSAIAYSLILKDVGVFMQTLYLMATDMRLGGCAIGTNNIELFAKMTGIEFHVEGPVGQFALGRGREPPYASSGPDSLVGSDRR
jgi:SagB-type dehydrogenase family enzyme